MDTFTYSADCHGAEGKSAVGFRPWSVQTLRALGAGSTTSDIVGAHRPALRLAGDEGMYRYRPRAGELASRRSRPMPAAYASPGEGTTSCNRSDMKDNRNPLIRASRRGATPQPGARPH